MRVYAALVVLTLARTAAGQSLDKVPAFEDADVKPSKGESPNGGKIRILPGGRLEMPNTTVKRLIMGAYGVQQDMVIGGPNWIDSDEFDIIAKAPPDTPRETIRAMLQPCWPNASSLWFTGRTGPSQSMPWWWQGMVPN